MAAVYRWAPEFEELICFSTSFSSFDKAVQSRLPKGELLTLINFKKANKGLVEYYPHLAKVGESRAGPQVSGGT